MKWKFCSTQRRVSKAEAIARRWVTVAEVRGNMLHYRIVRGRAPGVDVHGLAFKSTSAAFRFIRRTSWHPEIVALRITEEHYKDEIPFFVNPKMTRTWQA